MTKNIQNEYITKDEKVKKSRPGILVAVKVVKTTNNFCFTVFESVSLKEKSQIEKHQKRQNTTEQR